MNRIVDIFDLAEKKGSVSGEIAVSELPELCSFLAADEGVIRFSAEGVGLRRGRPAAFLSIEGKVKMFCARCNKPVDGEIASEGVFLFTKTEAEADAMPVAEDEDGEDVVVGSRRFNLNDWVQEEVILSLPATVVHEQCDEDLWEDEPETETEAKPNPFAVLAGLKTGK